jgi:hypothetical protein
MRNTAEFVAIFTKLSDRVAALNQYTVRQEVRLKDLV